jgi:hypothetical protein
MADFKDLFNTADEEQDVVETVAAPVVEAAPAPVAAPAPAPAAVAPAVKVAAASADEWEVAPGVWQIVTPVTGAFTLPVGTWVRPTEAEGISRAAVPAKWVEYVRALKG